MQSYSGMLRNFVVYLDGTKIDSIGSGEGKTYQVSPGKHSLEVRFDFYRSPPVHLSLDAGSMISLVCGDGGPQSLQETYTLKGLAQLAGSFVSPNTYLFIRPADTGHVATPTHGTAVPPSGNPDNGIRVDTPLQAVKSRQGSHAKPGSELFLSYRRSDSGVLIGRLCDRLFSHYGEKNVFRDVDSIPLGVDFREHIRTTIARCSAVIAVIGPDWLTASTPGGERRIDDPGDFVRIELELALAHGMPLIPLLVRGATMPSSEALPESIAELAYRNAFVLPDDPYFHVGVDKLLSDLDALETPAPPPAAPGLRFCTDCGTELTPGFRFCTGCGMEMR